MLSKRISALALLALILIVLLFIGFKSWRNGREFPKYNRFYYMKEYLTEVETFLKDNFPLRDSLRNSGVELQMLMGEKEFDGIFVADDMLIETMKQPDEGRMANNLSQVQAFVEMDCSTPMAVLYLPSKYAIKQKELPEYAENFAFNEKSFIESSYESLRGKATAIDAYSTLLSNSDKYLYYRTDPNLTGLGAYYVYNTLLQRLGLTPLSQDNFEQQHLIHDFYGETYENSSYKKVSADIITLYHPNNQAAVSVTHNTDYRYTYNTLYPQHSTALYDDLSIILGGNTGDISIDAAIKRQRSLLVFGDSSMLPVLPLLSAHYSHIRFIDFEYWNDTALEELNVEGYDQILLAYSVDSMVHDRYPAQLEKVREQMENRE